MSLGTVVRRAAAADTAPPPPTYPAVVLADSPAGYWRLGDAPGATSAAAAAGTAGTVAGTITFGQAGALVGDADTAASFNGTNALVNLAAQNVAADKSFSHECWFKLSGVNTNLYMTSETNTGSNNQLIGLSLQVGKVQGIFRDDANVAVTIQSPLTYNNNAYHHAVMTADATTMRLYVDGAEVINGAMSTLGAITLNAASIGAARRVATALFYLGILDEVSFYPVALSAAQVTAHRNAGLGL